MRQWWKRNAGTERALICSAYVAEAFCVSPLRDWLLKKAIARLDGQIGTRVREELHES